MRAFPIYVLSGGTGASGSQLVRTALAQFEQVAPQVIVAAHLRDATAVTDTVARAAAAQALIVHTLVDPNLRQLAIAAARKQRVDQVDAMGPLLERLTRHLELPPLGKPGRYHALREEDLKRIEAIEFAVEHDDGKRTHELHLAEIVLTGVSRVGKTPVAMLLSTLGWKTANVPLVPGIEPPEDLFKVDHRRVVGLTIEPGQLIHYRQQRQRHLGAPTNSAYSTADQLPEELNYAQAVFRKGGFSMIDMTDKPVEEAADDVIAAVRRRLG